jgi:hypothetical protein
MDQRAAHVFFMLSRLANSVHIAIDSNGTSRWDWIGLDWIGLDRIYSQNVNLMLNATITRARRVRSVFCLHARLGFQHAWHDQQQRSRSTFLSRSIEESSAAGAECTSLAPRAVA